jgi:hypothetical protein
MSKPEFLDELIDRASKQAGSDYKLAQMLQTTRQTVSNWRHGRKTCPAGDVALMADLAGMDGEAWACRALVAQYQGTPKGDAIARVLGKALIATGAVIVSSGASAATMLGESVGHFIRCIRSKVVIRFAA